MPDVGMKDVIVVMGAGFIGQAIARRIGAGKHLLVANHSADSSQQAAELGRITGLVHAAGVSPSQAPINAISPGIVITPLARDELNGPRGAGYRRMVEGCPVGRVGTPDEVANVAALLMGPDGAFITGSDVLMDGGVTASYRFGDLAPR